MATAINAPSVSAGSNPHDLAIGPTKGNDGKVNVGTKTTFNRAAAARMLEEERIFTFKPKVSPQSVKIAESLGSDFMTRQQQHIERQKKYVSQRSMYQKCLNLHIVMSAGLLYLLMEF